MGAAVYATSSNALVSEDVQSIGDKRDLRCANEHQSRCAHNGLVASSRPSRSTSHSAETGDFPDVGKSPRNSAGFSGYSRFSLSLIGDRLRTRRGIFSGGANPFPGILVALAREQVRQSGEWFVPEPSRDHPNSRTPYRTVSEVADSIACLSFGRRPPKP
jgi:hypothetical protein